MKRDTQRIEVFNFKNKHSQIKFKELIENTTDLSKIFDTEENIEIKTKKFKKKFNQILHQSFKKIRIKPAKDTHIDRLFRTQKDLKNKSDKESKVKLKQVEYELTDQMAEDLYNNVEEEVKLKKL